MSEGKSGCLKFLLLLLVVIGVGVFVYQKGYLFRLLNPKAGLQYATAEINKKTPRLLDEFTRLDSATVEGDRAMALNLTVLNFNGRELVPNAAAMLRSRAAAQYRTSPQLKPLRDAGITVTFRFHTQFGVKLMEFAVGPKDL